MEVVSKTFSEGEREQLLEVVHGRVDRGRRDGKEHQREHSLHELLEVLSHDRLDNSAIHICQPNGEIGSHNQETREYYQVQGLLSIP